MLVKTGHGGVCLDSPFGGAAERETAGSLASARQPASLVYLFTYPVLAQ